MKRTYEPSTVMEKERRRAQISLQVDEFLRSGGQISVLTSSGDKVRALIGSAWNEQEDLVQISE